MRQILTGLDAMHKTGIVHRDIKPQNLILTDNGIKMIDLGACADLRVGINYVPNEYLLDPRFAPPQQYVMSPLTPRCALPHFQLLCACAELRCARPEPMRACAAHVCAQPAPTLTAVRHAAPSQRKAMITKRQGTDHQRCLNIDPPVFPNFLPQFEHPPGTTSLACSAPPLPLAAFLSPVLWRLNQPDRFDMYSAGIVFLQLAFAPLRSDNNLVAFNKKLESCDYDLDTWRESFSRRANSQYAGL